MDQLIIDLPNSQQSIRPGNIVKLNRFATQSWKVCYGWYEFGGNRPVCGWYLEKDNGLTIKPLQLPDLDDIYLIST